MKILVIDDDGFELTKIAQGNGEHEVATLKVSFGDCFGEITHASVQEAVEEILAQKPDAIFLDHDLGELLNLPFGQKPPNGETVARLLRANDYAGRIIGTSSSDQPYCDAKAGKVRRKTLTELLALV